MTVRSVLAAALSAAALAVTGCSGASNPGVDGPGAGGDAPRVDARLGVDAPPGADASLPTTDPADDGPFAVTTSNASIPGSAPGRVVPATVYRPASTDPLPLVVVSPGFQMPRTQYGSYAQHLATWGFVVVLTDYADGSFFPDHDALAADLGAVIDWASAQTSFSIDPARIGAAGHSLGGKISVLGAVRDPRIGAVVAWDPVDSTTPSVAPELIADAEAAVAVIGETTNGSGGGMPCAPAAENFEQFYAAAPAPALRMTMLGADHMDWVDDPSCAFCGFCSPGSLQAAVTRTATRRLDVAWMRRQLFADTAMDPWLADPPEVAAGDALVDRR